MEHPYSIVDLIIFLVISNKVRVEFNFIGLSNKIEFLLHKLIMYWGPLIVSAFSISLPLSLVVFPRKKPADSGLSPLMFIPIYPLIHLGWFFTMGTICAIGALGQKYYLEIDPRMAHYVFWEAGLTSLSIFCFYPILVIASPFIALYHLA